MYALGSISFKSQLNECFPAGLLPAGDEVVNLLLALFHDQRNFVVTHPFEVGQVQCLSVLGVYLPECFVELLVPFVLQDLNIGGRAA